MDTLIALGIVLPATVSIFLALDMIFVTDAGKMIPVWPVPQLRTWQQRAEEKWDRVERGVIVTILFILFSILWPVYIAGVVLFGVYKVLGGFLSYFHWRGSRVVKFFRVLKVEPSIPEAKVIRE